MTSSPFVRHLREVEYWLRSLVLRQSEEGEEGEVVEGGEHSKRNHDATARC